MDFYVVVLMRGERSDIGYQPTEHGGPSRHSLGSKANTPAQLNNLPQGYLDGSFATTADRKICVKGERRTKVRSERT